jgi:2-dehydro-3-deoxygluconokinase
MARVACIGECMLELSGLDSQAMTLSYGGDTLNTAVYLSRLGVETAYVTALGDDPYSDWMIAQWRGEGVGTELVIRAKDRVPGLYAIRTDETGERRFFYWRDQAPARDLLAFPESDNLAHKLIEFDWIYLSGISLSLYSAAQLARLFAILDAAREKGCKLMFDTNYRPRGWADAATARETIAEVLVRTDLAAPTLDDDEQVFGDTDAASCADRLHAAGVCEVVVKMDAEGCLVSTQEGRERVATTRKANPVDTTGAGDSFNAGYLAARLAGDDPVLAAGRAHRLAGEVIMHRGAIMPREAMPGGDR